MNRRRSSVMLGGLCAAALALACGKQATEPVVDAHLPPGVIEVFPAARATRVGDTTPIWARFDRPLDSHTVGAKTVFLKVDTRRLPVTVSLADSNRTIRIQPLGPLDLRRTHTVELTSEIRTQDGGAFAETYYWQFQTSSIRTPRIREPVDGAIDESPVTPLSWARSDSAGAIEYRVMVSADSAAVAAGSAPSLSLTHEPYVPTSRWTPGATLYWSVHVRNLDTGEEDGSPVARFTVIAADAPMDSVFLPITDPGTFDRGTWRCPNLSSGISGVTGIFRLDPTTLGADVVVHKAEIVLAPLNFLTPTTFAQAAPFLLAMEQDWVACNSRYPGAPPLPDAGGIASGALGNDGLIHYESDALSAHVQNALRSGALRGFVTRSSRSLNYAATATTSGFRVVYYVRAPHAARGSHR